MARKLRDIESRCTSNFRWGDFCHGSVGHAGFPGLADKARGFGITT